MRTLIMVFLIGAAGGYALYQTFKEPPPIRYTLEQYSCNKAYYNEDGKEKMRHVPVKLSFSTATSPSEQLGSVKMLRTAKESTVVGYFEERDGKLWSPKQVTGGGVAIDLDRTNAYLTVDGVPTVTFKIDECETLFKYK